VPKKLTFYYYYYYYLSSLDIHATGPKEINNLT